jgi:hypothetical protein
MGQRSLLGIAVIAVALSSGCSKKADDASVVTSIKSQMLSDPQLKDASVQVTSRDGQVTLSGAVPNDAAHLEAYKLATQTPSVTKVIDQITIQAAEPQLPETRPAPATAAATEKVRPKKHKLEPKPMETAQVTTPPTPTPAPESQAAPAAQPQLTPAPALQPPPPPPPQPRQVQIPANTTVTIRMIDGVDSSVNHPGELFHGSLEAPIVADDQVVVPRGTDVYVRLASATSTRHMTGSSELRLELVKLEFQGQSYPLVSSTHSLSGGSRSKDTAKKVGAGAVLGTLIGAIAGGGKGAAIGAGVGAGAGGVYQGTTKGKQLKVPAETKLDFQLEQPVTVSVQPHSTPPAE